MICTRGDAGFDPGIFKIGLMSKSFSAVRPCASSFAGSALCLSNTRTTLTEPV